MSENSQSAGSGYEAALSSQEPSRQEDWEIRLGFVIHDAARMRRIIIDEKFKPLGVTRSQAWVVAYLSRRDGMTQSDLADDMGLGKVTLGGLIDRLEDVKMVERRADAVDRRVKRIFLTKLGRKIIKDMRKLTAEVNEDILQGVSPEEVKSCVQTLKKLNTNLSKLKSKVEAN